MMIKYAKISDFKIKKAEDYEEATDSAEPVLKLYDDDGEVLATTPDWFGFAPDSRHMDFVSPPKGAYGLNDLIQIEVTAGPHQTETMFLELKGKELLPICKTVNPVGIDDCLFYNSSGELGVEAGLLGGLGEDDRLAVVEYEDEYLPSNTKLDDKTIKIIDETFKEKSDMAKLIAAMVKVDRERQVAWNIYIYNGKYFEVQSGENYDKYFNELKNNAERKFEITDILEPILIKRSEMSEESVKYVEFVKNFWTKKEQQKSIIYYAKAKRISNSGDMRFYWYDLTTKSVKDPNNEYSWFFALPANISNDHIATNKWVKYIQDNTNAVFKINGKIESYDCDYYGLEHCIENINIENIEVVK